MAKKRSYSTNPGTGPFRALFYDSAGSGYLKFEHPQSVVAANDISQVLPVLRHVEGHLQAGGYAVGFLAYEAAPAFDPAFRVKRMNELPLCCFALFDHPECDAPPTKESANWALHLRKDITRKEFDRSFKVIKSNIRNGATYQVNYTHKQHFHFYGDPFSIFSALVGAQPTPFAAFIEYDDWAICSASPELFFSLNGNEISCKPMKGTIARGQDNVSDQAQKSLLQNSEKDRAENVMIVDMIRNDLGRIAETGSVRVPSLYDVQAYPTLWQMTSTVRAKTDAGLVDILSALFPCASITGAPKIRTMEIIDEIESEPRNIYTGAIGLLKPNRKWQFSVAIRTALIKPRERRLEYGIGSGVVWDSRAEAEFAECKLKSKIVADTTVKFDLLETILLKPDEGYFLLEEHIQRMKRAAECFGYPFDSAAIRSALKKHGIVTQPCKVRLLLSAAGETRISTSPIIDGPVVVRLKLAKMPVCSNSVFLKHKTTNRTVYDKAMGAALDCDDVILFNESGHLTETTIYNMALQIDGRLYTPPVEAGLLPGTMRAYLLQNGVIEERKLSISDLDQCEKIFVFNSVRGMLEAVLLSDG